MFFWWLTFPDAVQIVLIVFPTADVICLLTDARCTHVCSHFFPLPPLVPSSDSPLPLFALSFPPSQLSTATGLNPTTRGTDAPSRLFSPTVLSHSPHVPPSQTPTSPPSPLLLQHSLHLLPPAISHTSSDDDDIDQPLSVRICSQLAIASHRQRSLTPVTGIPRRPPPCAGEPSNEQESPPTD
jgi:hypothetical protein